MTDPPARATRAAGQDVVTDAPPLKLSLKIAIIYEACLRRGPRKATTFRARNLWVRITKRYGPSAEYQLLRLSRRHKVIAFDAVRFSGEGWATVTRVPYVVVDKRKAGHREPPAWTTCNWLYNGDD